MGQANLTEYKHRHDERRGWGAGKWDDEPDKVQWVDTDTDLDCLMHRNPMGAWCGYVGVAEGHPAFGKHYDEVYATVHGGLTYSDFCQEGNDETIGICHVPAEGRPHRVWWLGFDCHHGMDHAPGYAASMRDLAAQMDAQFAGLSEKLRVDEAEYRDRAYVEHEVAELAAQLAQMAA